MYAALRPTYQIPCKNIIAKVADGGHLTVGLIRGVVQNKAPFGVKLFEELRTRRACVAAGC